MKGMDHKDSTYSKPMPKKDMLDSPAMDHIRSGSISTQRSNSKGGKK